MAAEIVVLREMVPMHIDSCDNRKRGVLHRDASVIICTFVTGIRTVSFHEMTT
jgi:hypothetical protein